MRISINDDRELEKKNKKATDKLLGLLLKHHEAAPINVIKIKEEIILCDNCKDPLLRLDGAPRVQDIKRIATRYFKLQPYDLDSARRTGPLCYSRQIAMYLSRTMTLKSFPEIARRMGGRDHTTAIHACNKIEGLVKSDWLVAFDVAALEAQVIGECS